MHKNRFIKQSIAAFRFTLIELLIVVAIVAILSSILLPALSKARNTVKRIACASNMKQIILVQAMYSQDNDDWIVSARNKQKQTWCTQLTGINPNGSKIPDISNYGLVYYGYTKNEGSFVCPAATDPLGSNTNKYYYSSHYAINSRLGGVDTWGEVNSFYYHRKISALTQASEAIFAVDNIRKNDFHANYPAFAAYRHGGSDPRHNPTDLTGTSALRGRSNVVFMDGHVNNKTYAQLYYASPAYYYFAVGFNISGVPF